MDVMDDLQEMNRGLVLSQIGLSELIEKLAAAQVKPVDIVTPSHKITPGGILIIIPEYPPKVDVISKTEIRDGKLNSRTYQAARNRWKGLIRKAVEGYEGPRIEPALVFITYYVPKRCDISNFIHKFIVDGLMDYRVTAVDDNDEKVSSIFQEVVRDKENPRTEIRVMKDNKTFRKLALIEMGELRADFPTGCNPLFSL